MKIALCTSSFDLGGVNTFLRVLSNGMRQVGHEADILLTSNNAGEDYKSALQEDLSIEAVSIGERWIRNRLKKVQSRLLNYNVIINNHSIETQLLLPTLPANIITLSVIHSVNQKILYQASLNSSFLDAMIAIAPENSLLLNQTNKINCPIHIIPNGLSIKVSEFKEFTNLIRIIYLGRITDIDKNILILPDIIKALKFTGKSFVFTIAGDGHDRHLLEKRIDLLAVRESVNLLGAVSHNVALELLKDSHFAIIPSNYEGLGMVLLEAMAVGCVPIISDIPQMVWILGKDADCLKAPVSDVQAYVNRICDIASKPELYRDIQNRLCKRQQKYFSLEATVKGYLSIISKLKAEKIRSNFTPVQLEELDMPSYYKRRCTRLWWLLQKCRYGLNDYQIKKNLNN